jgi:hypothetical protein
MAFNEIMTKILLDFEKKMSEKLFFHENLKNFNLFDFENNLFTCITDLYNEICSVILTNFLSSENFRNYSEDFIKKMGGGKLKKRNTGLQLRTGKIIELPNLYIEQSQKPWQGARHLLHLLFGTINKASPAYYSTVSMYSIVCPSFETASLMLKTQFVETNYDRVRDLSLAVGKKSIGSRVGIQLAKEETLENKSVIISIDGGRTRIRQEKEELNKQETYHLYDTPWIEPKLFVIHILDSQTGKQSKVELPIYDCTFGDDQCFELLGKYLKFLKIENSKSVQFIADGASWIWNRAKEFLINLGVKPENIIETLDYYHGVEHLSEIVKSLPKNIAPPNRNQMFKELKELLWQGKITEIQQKLKQVVKRTNKVIKKELRYFEKHRDRCRYSFFKENKFLCGSGIIESGIRRVINLRFKCPSSFWDKENLEPLIFLRATFLSKRWDNMIQNLAKL